jgi:hypothetical protein
MYSAWYKTSSKVRDGRKNYQQLLGGGEGATDAVGHPPNDKLSPVEHYVEVAHRLDRTIHNQTHVHSREWDEAQHKHRQPGQLDTWRLQLPHGHTKLHPDQDRERNA